LIKLAVRWLPLWSDQAVDPWLKRLASTVLTESSLRKILG
jgi:hypothetical protein